MKYAPYSYSKISLYEQCPYRFYIQYILKPKIKVPASYYLEKGNFVHSLIESILKENIKEFKIPSFKILQQKDKVSIYKTILDFCSHTQFKNIKVYDNKLIEHKFFLDTEISPTDKKNCLIKGKIDLLYETDKQLWIYDWKTTGQTIEKLKKYPKKDDQLELYALWGLQQYKLNEAFCSFAYVDVNYYDERIFTIDDIPELKEKWIQKIETIEETTYFDRHKTVLCDYCENQSFCEKTQQIEIFDTTLETTLLSDMFH